MTEGLEGLIAQKPACEECGWHFREDTPPSDYGPFCECGGPPKRLSEEEYDSKKEEISQLQSAIGKEERYREKDAYAENEKKKRMESRTHEQKVPVKL